MPPPKRLRRELKPAEVQKLLDAGKSKRYLELESYQAYYESTQYEGMTPWFDSASDKPRLERAPCVVYPIVEEAIHSHVALAMGDRRFPRVLSATSEEGTAFDGRFGISKDESEDFDAFNANLVELADMPASCRQALRMAMAARSVAVIWSYRNGLPCPEVQWAKVCTPTFDPRDPDEVIRLEIRYRYTEQWLEPTSGKWWTVVKEYLRVIDNVADTSYVPVEIWEVEDPGPSVIDKDSTFTHGFGLCPVRWYAHQQIGRSKASFDGVALHDRKTRECDAINHALSTNHGAALYSGDPQLFGSGISPDDDLGAAGGRVAQALPLPGEQRTEWSRAIYGSPSGTAAIRKGPGVLWRVAAPDAKLAYLALPLGALEALENDAKTLCANVREAFHYVWIDPATLTGSGDISGKTLAFVYSSQTSFVDDVRADSGKRLVLATLNLLYRMLLANSDGVYLPGIAKALPILKRFQQPVTSGSGAQSTAWFPPRLKLKWGAYFDPNEADDSARVTTTAAAKDAGIITLSSAVEHVRDVFGDIDNVEEYVKTLQKEQDDNADKEMQRMTDSANDMAQGEAKAKASFAPKPGVAGKPTGKPKPKAA